MFLLPVHNAVFLINTKTHDILSNDGDDMNKKDPCPFSLSNI